MKVLLIYPPDVYPQGEDYFVTFPLGLAYIAALLENNRHEVKVIDCVIESWKVPIPLDEYFHVGLSWNELRRRIALYSPDMVGITCLFSSQSQNVHETAKIVKEINKDIKVTVGGAHPSALPAEMLEDFNIDFVVIGEGEYTVLEVVNNLNNYKKIKKIDGLGFRTKSGNTVINQKRNFIENLDELPFPARYLFLMEEYLNNPKAHAMFTKRTPYISMITSRGCPFRCVFCSIHVIWGQKWRARSPSNVVDEIEDLVNKYGIKEVHFEDDNLTIDKKRAGKIFDEMCERNLDITWTTPNGVHVNALDEDLLVKMKKSGCYALFYGIESGNQSVLNGLMKKNLSLSKVEKVIVKAKNLGIKNIGYFVLGVPGETKSTINDTIKFSKSLDLDEAWFSLATPYPGSEMYDECKEKGYLDVKDISKLKPKYPNINTGLLSSKELERLRNRAYLEFELNRAIKQPLNIFKKSEFKKFGRYLRFILKNRGLLSSEGH